MVANELGTPSLPGYKVQERKEKYGKHAFFAVDPQTGVITERAENDSKMVKEKIQN